MNCNIIKDLLPSYIDGICSEDTVKAIEDHKQHCEDCKHTLKSMQQQTDYVPAIPEEVEKAITPFKKINKKRRIQVIVAIVLTFMITITIGGVVVQEVEPVRQIFFPSRSAVVVVDFADGTEEWERVIFSDSAQVRDFKDYLVYDSVFWKKEITNSASNGSSILLRVKDENGLVVVDELKIESGTSVKLDSLKEYEKYFFEIKTTVRRSFITAS